MRARLGVDLLSVALDASSLSSHAACPAETASARKAARASVGRRPGGMKMRRF
jgi:hypothetical protein